MEEEFVISCLKFFLEIEENRWKSLFQILDRGALKQHDLLGRPHQE
jgi:hypothetical protein